MRITSLAAVVVAPGLAGLTGSAGAQTPRGRKVHLLLAGLPAVPARLA
jgi:hypothetical protein